MKDSKIEPGDVIAVGDIHGASDLLWGLLDYVEGSQCTLIFLGDLIDRGPRSVECLAAVKHLCENPDSRGLEGAYCLLGNHEAALVDAVEAGEGSDAELQWRSIGGDVFTLPFMARYVPWLKTLPYVIMDEDTIFAHAGVIPGQSPNQSIQNGMASSLYWIREPFLVVGPKLRAWTSKYKRVVHGHTPAFGEFGEYGIKTWPDVSASLDRIGIDTGAVWTGVLTAFNSTQNTYFSINADPDRNFTAPFSAGLQRPYASGKISVSEGVLPGTDYEQRDDCDGDVCFSKHAVLGNSRV